MAGILAYIRGEIRHENPHERRLPFGWGGPFGVTVNGVAPHAIRTEMSAEWSDEKKREVIASIPLKRLGEPHEVAAAVLFLVSASAGFITGEIIDVNGGTIMD